MGLGAYAPYIHMGMASAVTRYSARHLARKEFDRLNEVVNTGIAYFRISALLFFVCTLLVASFSMEWLVKNPDMRGTARVCILIFGSIESIAMCLGPLSGIFWALERFDVSSISTTLSRLFRLVALAAILPWCDAVTGLVVVTTIMCLTNFSPGFVYRILAPRYIPNLKFNMRLARIGLVWPMMSFGLASMLYGSAQVLGNYIPLLLISHSLSSAHAAEYEIATRAILLASMLVQSITMVVSPTTSKLTATDRRKELTGLFVRSAKYAGGMAVFGCAAIGILAPILITLWVGDGFERSATVMTLLAIGWSQVLSQSSSYYMLVGMAKQRVPAFVAMTVVLSMGVAQYVALAHLGWGLTGAASIMTIGLVLGWGICIPLYACKQVGLGLMRYYSITVGRPILAALPASAAWLAVRWYMPSQGWSALGVAVLSGGLLSGLGCWFLLFDDWDRRFAREKLSAIADKLRRRSS